MVRGSPRMCIRISGSLQRRATSAMRGSFRKAVTSFRISAPAAAAASATSDLLVSTEIGILIFPRSFSKTGSIRCSSSFAETPFEPGLVDSPPMSRMSAPARSISSARATAASALRKIPPSEKLSGVTLRTPITSVRSPSNSVLEGKRSLNLRRRNMGHHSITDEQKRHDILGCQPFRCDTRLGGGASVVAGAGDDIYAGVPYDFDAQGMPSRTTGRIRRRRESEGVFGANSASDLAKCVGERVGFAQEIKLASRAAHEFCEIQSVGGNFQVAGVTG